MEAAPPGVLNVAAIITARGGSKGLPRKHERLLAGKPLLAHTILAALDCPRVSRCVVTTEDEALKRLAREWGAEVIDRPSALAQDGSLSRDVVRHALETLEAQGTLPEAFALLQPTSPLRTAAHVTACVELFESSKAASVVGVCESEHSPYKDFRMVEGRLVPLFDADGLDKPRQSLPKTYRQNGAVYVLGSRAFLDEGRFHLEPSAAYIMDSDESIDIDVELDLLIAEQILARRSASTTEKNA
jgi:CMP-N,N'-diacetyllegionaminic acid synthase